MKKGDMTLARRRKVRISPLLRGASRVFDLFGAHAMRPRLSSLADDAQQLRSDFAVVGDDIAAVFAEQSRSGE
jgi:hypothetical protein